MWENKDLQSECLKILCHQKFGDTIHEGSALRNSRHCESCCSKEIRKDIKQRYTQRHTLGLMGRNSRQQLWQEKKPKMRRQTKKRMIKKRAEDNAEQK